jgi:hypothetical protein
VYRGPEGRYRGMVYGVVQAVLATRGVSSRGWIYPGRWPRVEGRRRCVGERALCLDAQLLARSGVVDVRDAMYNGRKSNSFGMRPPRRREAWW